MGAGDVAVAGVLQVHVHQVRIVQLTFSKADVQDVDRDPALMVLNQRGGAEGIHQTALGKAARRVAYTRGGSDADSSCPERLGGPEGTGGSHNVYRGGEQLGPCGRSNQTRAGPRWGMRRASGPHSTCRSIATCHWRRHGQITPSHCSGVASLPPTPGLPHVTTRTHGLHAVHTPTHDAFLHNKPRGDHD